MSTTTQNIGTMNTFIRARIDALRENMATQKELGQSHEWELGAIEAYCQMYCAINGTSPEDMVSAVNTMFIVAISPDDNRLDEWLAG